MDIACTVKVHSHPLRILVHEVVLEFRPLYQWCRVPTCDKGNNGSRIRGRIREDLADRSLSGWWILKQGNKLAMSRADLPLSLDTHESCMFH
jgi:hypothetical protein